MRDGRGRIRLPLGRHKLQLVTRGAASEVTAVEVSHDGVCQVDFPIVHEGTP
jgi:hypothetical protein